MARADSSHHHPFKFCQLQDRSALLFCRGLKGEHGRGSVRACPVDVARPGARGWNDDRCELSTKLGRGGRCKLWCVQRGPGTVRGLQVARRGEQGRSLSRRRRHRRGGGDYTVVAKDTSGTQEDGIIYASGTRRGSGVNVLVRHYPVRSPPDPSPLAPSLIASGTASGMCTPGDSDSAISAQPDHAVHQLIRTIAAEIDNQYSDY